MKPFELSDRLLPTKHDCLLYVLSQTNQHAEKMSPKSVVCRLPKLAEEIWNKVDCSPSSNKTITKLFESGIWDNYKSLIREHYLPRESFPSTRKRSHIKDPSKQKQWYVLFFYLKYLPKFSSLFFPSKIVCCSVSFSVPI